MIENWTTLNMFWMACLAAGLGGVGAYYKKGMEVSGFDVLMVFLFNSMLGGGAALLIYEIPYIGKARAVGLAALTGVGVVKISKISRIADMVLPGGDNEQA